MCYGKGGAGVGMAKAGVELRRGGCQAARQGWTRAYFDITRRSSRSQRLHQNLAFHTAPLVLVKGNMMQTYKPTTNSKLVHDLHRTLFKSDYVTVVQYTMSFHMELILIPSMCKSQDICFLTSVQPVMVSMLRDRPPCTLNFHSEGTQKYINVRYKCPSCHTNTDFAILYACSPTPCGRVTNLDVYHNHITNTVGNGMAGWCCPHSGCPLSLETSWNEHNLFQACLT